MASGARHFSRRSFSRLSFRWGHLRVPGRRSLRRSSRPACFRAAQSEPGATTSRSSSRARAATRLHNAVADVLGLSLKDARTFSSIDGVAVDLTGAQVLALAADNHVTAITADSLVRLSATALKWPYVTGVNKYWATTYSSAAPASTIAIVDSGIDASRPEFAGRVVANVNLSSLSGNSAGDGRGHGTFVAGIAASSLAGKSGAAPTREDRLPRRHGRQGHGEDERRHRCRRLDPGQQVRSTASASRTSRSIHLSPTASGTTRSTRRSRGSGSTTSWSWPPPATTARPTDPAAFPSHPATTRL